MKYCRKCGSQMEDTALSCSECGYEVRRQNSMAEGALYGAAAAGPTPTGTWTPVMTEERKRKIRKKKAMTAVGITAVVALLACAAGLLLHFDVFSTKTEHATAMQSQSGEEPADKTQEEKPSTGKSSTEETTTEEVTEETTTEATTEETPTEVPEPVTEEAPAEVPETTTEEPPAQSEPEQSPAPTAPTGEKRLIVTPPYKTLYTPGESLSLNGMVVTMQNADGSTDTITSGYQVSPKDISGGGSHVITVSYQGYTATFTVDVITRIDMTGDGGYVFSNGMTFASYDEMPQQYKDLVNKFGMAP